jgi:hypothetical protein
VSLYKIDYSTLSAKSDDLIDSSRICNRRITYVTLMAMHHVIPGLLYLFVLGKGTLI